MGKTTTMIDKIENKYQHTALIDADFIIWIACNPNKVKDKWGNPKREEGKFVYTDKTVEEAIETCDAYINDVLNITHADSYLLFLTTGATFRSKIDPTYKANRIGFERPKWFAEVKQHMIDKWDAIEKAGLEADDMVVITKNHLSNCFIVAADKDILDSVPGRHFDARKGKQTFVEVSVHQSRFNFAKSLLTGDTVDGIPNLIKGMGPKTAEAELERRMEHNNPIICALQIFISNLGEHEGLIRFCNQYRLMKMIENLSQLPDGMEFAIREPYCWNCVETLLGNEFTDFNYDTSDRTGYSGPATEHSRGMLDIL
jgi:hypothetical protein